MLLRHRRLIFTLLFIASTLRNRGNSPVLGKNKLNNLNIPSFKNLLEVKSSILGRVRFYSPAIVSNKQMADTLIDYSKKILAIKKAEVNLLTGSILIEYSPEEVDATTLEGVVIKILGLDGELDGGRVSNLEKEVKNMTAALNNGIYDFTNGYLNVKSLLAVVFIMLAIYDIRKLGTRRMPDYATLLWWTTALF